MNGIRLPKTAQEIANVIGVERTLYLIGQLPRVKAGPPGKEGWRVVLYVPKTLPLDHQLVRILGWQDAEKLCKHFPGEILSPPTCDSVYRRFRDENIRKLYAQGNTTRAIAYWLGITERHVRNIVQQEAQA